MSFVGFWRRRPTYTWSAMPTSINEGATATYSVNTTYVAAGTTLYWTINNSSTANADFSQASGSFTISNATGSFNIGPVADLTTEVAAETFTVSISRTNGGTPVLTSSTITIGDTSQTPTTTTTVPPYYASVLIPSSTIDQSVRISTTKPIGIVGGTAPYTYSVSPTLPPGLIFDTTNGEITRAASVSAPATNYTVTIVDSVGNSASAAFSLTVVQGKPGTTFLNPSFEDGTIGGDAATGWTLPGWKIFTNVVKLNGNSTILGWPTPNDSTVPPNGVQDAPPRPGNFSVNFELSTDIPPSGGTRCLRLFSSGNTDSPYGIIHGPYAVSDQSITVSAGDEVEFYWRAAGGFDAFDIYAYFLNTATGATIELLNASGDALTITTPWARVSKVFTAADAGTYSFVFISGTFDLTGGQLLGASLFVDGISVIRAAPLP